MLAYDNCPQRLFTVVFGLINFVLFAVIVLCYLQRETAAGLVRPRLYDSRNISFHSSAAAAGRVNHSIPVRFPPSTRVMLCFHCVCCRLRFSLRLPAVRHSRYFTLLAPYPPDMIVGIAKSHAKHAADKVQQVQLPPSWNTRPVVAQPLHIGFVSGDFRGHVTAHLLQVMRLRVCTRDLSHISSFTACARIDIV